MLTFFTTAEPFRGHIGVIQRNTLKSWKLLYPDVEIILFGDDEGVADAAREFSLTPTTTDSTSRKQSIAC